MSKKSSLLRRNNALLFVALAMPLLFTGGVEAQLIVGPEQPLAPSDVERLARAGRVDAATDGETILAVWTDRRRDRSSDIFAARIDRNGRLRDTNISVTNTPDLNESDPFVEFNGTNFVAVWFDGTNTAAAEIDVAGNIISGPAVVAPGRPTSVIRGGRDVAVSIVDGPETRIGLIRAGVDYLQHAEVRPTNNVKIARFEAGFVVLWMEEVQRRNTFVIRGLRLDNRGRTAATFSLGDLGEFGPDATMAVATTDGNNAVVAAADRNRFVVARLRADGVVTVLHTITGVASRVVEEVIPRGAVFDVITITGGRSRIYRFTNDTLTLENEPVAGLAGDGAAAYTGTRLFTIWQIAGELIGRFAFAPQDPLVPITFGVVSQQLPALASDNLNALAVWTEDIGDTTDRIVASLITREGTPISPRPLILAQRQIAPNASRPAVALSGNHYFIAWVDARNGIDKPAQLIMRTVDRGGVAAGDINVSPTANPTESPALATGPTDALLAWTRALPTQRVRYTFVSNPTLEQFELTDITREPAVVFASGSYMLAGGRPAGGLRGVMISHSGLVERIAFETTPPAGVIDSEPVLAFNGGSDVLLVFRRGESLFGRFVAADGTSSGADFLIAENIGAHHPAVTWDGQAFIVAYAVAGDVLVSRVLLNGTVESAVPLSPIPSHDDFPALLGLGGGNTLAAYQRTVTELLDVQRVFTRMLSTTPVVPPKPGKSRAVRR